MCRLLLRVALPWIEAFSIAPVSQDSFVRLDRGLYRQK